MKQTKVVNIYSSTLKGPHCCSRRLQSSTGAWKKPPVKWQFFYFVVMTWWWKRLRIENRRRVDFLLENIIRGGFEWGEAGEK